MAHSHDKTYIASLGFSDKDKKDGTHDLACQYLAEEENLIKIFKNIYNLSFNENKGKCKFSTNTNYYNPLIIKKEDTGNSFEISFEELINKGTGQYKTTVGFIDLKIQMFSHFSIEEFKIEDYYYASNVKQLIEQKYSEKDIFEICHECFNDKKISKYDKYYDDRINKTVIVEVKIHPIDISAAIRQIKFYESYLIEESYTTLNFILATMFKISEEDLKYLENEGINHIYLGAKFQDYIVDRKSNKKEAEMTEI